MQILSHRGYWKTLSEMNTAAALAHSFQMGFGTETDLRDLAGRLVVSHDPPSAEALPAEQLFAIHQQKNARLPLALNIKADGLTPMVKPLLDRYAVSEAFVFDMSVPDMRAWLAAGVPVFTRQSEVERDPVYYRQAAGVWMDAFVEDWIDEAAIARHLTAGKRVCIVSPELHKREHRPFWERLAKMPRRSDPRVMLCTDHPEEAKSLLA